MKSIKFLRSLAALAVGIFSILNSGAHADGGFRTRYHTTYRNFDRGFHDNYGYDERVRYSRCGYYTCYSGYYDSTPVYIEEAIVEGGTYNGYTKVSVYQSSSYASPYASYYTYRGTVIRRSYYTPQPYLSNHYYHDMYYYHPPVYYVQMDQFTAELMLGTVAVQLGAEVLLHCRSGDEGCALVGLASMVSGSISWSIASARENERRETALSKRISVLEEQQKSSTRDIE